MTVYTVHKPPPRTADAGTDTDRFVFIRDGFYLRAFIFAPLWMLWHRLWLVLLGYVAVISALQTALWALGASGFVKTVVSVLVSLLVGLEAASLRRWTLSRRKWRNVGVVVASDLDSAERRFFDSWVSRDSRPRSGGLPVAANLPAVPVPPMRMSPDDVIGLFPEPQARPRS
jgi:hypothetical protein